MCCMATHAREIYIFRVYINFAHHIEEYMAGVLYFSLHSGRSLFYVHNFKMILLSLPLFPPRVSCQASHFSSPIQKIMLQQAQKFYTNVNVCGRKPNGWMG